GRNSRITSDADSPYLLSVDSAALARYHVDPKWDDLRQELYAQKNYSGVETTLASMLQAPGDGAHDELNRLYGFLSTPFGASTSETMKPVLDEWVVRSTDSYAAHLLRGCFYVGYAWQARGNGESFTVTAEGKRLFSDRLAIAKEDLEIAYVLNPHEAYSSANLIRVAMGLGLPRAVMERYFDQAVAQRPGDAVPYILKMRYLAPKWYGTVEDISAVAEDAKGRSGEHPRLARIWALSLLEQAMSSDPKNSPLASVERWEGIQAIYEGLLTREPDDLALRAEYARLAYLSGQYLIAAEQYDRVGDRWVPGTNDDLPSYNFARADAYDRLAWEYEQKHDDAAAVRRYQNAVDLGFSRAMSSLGLLYANGRGVPKDYAAAMALFQRAASFQDASGYAYMGWLNAMGYGVPINAVEAVRCYKQASDLGNDWARYELGRLYLEGKLLPRDFSESSRYLEKAANDGGSDAQTLLGWMYEQGDGVPRDYQTAAKWFRLAAAQGDNQAIANLKSLQDGGQLKAL
ncbi:MAG TPA: tetratricopeptide repeat protein, partial [Elusimicrobiota bacterium]|nr:tetratricopeptide repeat protein [Elusimicrobiota bacterium]